MAITWRDTEVAASRLISRDCGTRSSARVELLGYVRHRAANEPEGNPMRPVERDRLQRGGGEPAAVNRRVVLGEHHVFPPLEHP